MRWSKLLMVAVASVAVSHAAAAAEATKPAVKVVANAKLTVSATQLDPTPRRGWRVATTRGPRPAVIIHGVQY